MAEGQRTEPFGEGHLARVVEVLVAQEHDLVLHERGADLSDRLVALRLADVDADDLRTDAHRQRLHVEAH